MKIFFIFLCFLWSSKIDSQQQEIERALYYLDKSNEFTGIDDLKSLQYAKKASLIAEKRINKNSVENLCGNWCHLP